MRLGKDLHNKLIISISDGQSLGKVKDIYVDADLQWMTGIYVGSEGLLRRKALLIQREDVVLYGIDAILVKNADVVTDDRALPAAKEWVRLDKLNGREVDTPGGTRLGLIGDIMLDAEGNVIGFTLAKTFVEGPIAQNGTVPRQVVTTTGSKDQNMTIDLPQLEQLYQGTPTQTKSETVEDDTVTG